MTAQSGSGQGEQAGPLQSDKGVTKIGDAVVSQIAGIAAQEVEKVQRPEGILAQTLSIGMASEKRVRGEILSLRERVRHDKNWFLRKRREIEKARDLIVKMENELVGES